jgi:hypothetical protein
MSAIVVDLKDFGVRTPQQVIRVFSAIYSAEEVKVELWEIFKKFSVAQEGENNADNLKSAANLFDHLIALVDALEKLRQNNSLCLSCGNISETDFSG